jgi:hypothetical protein
MGEPVYRQPEIWPLEDKPHMRQTIGMRQSVRQCQGTVEAGQGLLRVAQ